MGASGNKQAIFECPSDVNRNKYIKKKKKKEEEEEGNEVVEITETVRNLNFVNFP